MFKDKLLRGMLKTFMKYDERTGEKYLESHLINDIWREFKWSKEEVRELYKRIEYLERIVEKEE